MYSRNPLINAKRTLKRLLLAAIGRDHIIFRDLRIQKTRLGTIYGGWFIAPEKLPKSEPPVVLSFGIGQDISFDREMIDRYGARVFGFDPTPKSIDWLERQKDIPADFKAFQYGIANFDGTQDFGLPTREDWDNYSAQRRSENSVTCQVRTLATLISELGVKQVDILKLDVEGAEYQIIDDILKLNPLPTQVLIEFHHTHDGIKVIETCKAVEAIRKAGYGLFDVSPWGHEFSFCLVDNK